MEANATTDTDTTKANVVLVGASQAVGERRNLLVEKKDLVEVSQGLVVPRSMRTR